jgi:hypothetical protein
MMVVVKLCNKNRMRILLIVFLLLLGCSKSVVTPARNIEENFSEDSVMEDVNIEIRENGQTYVIHADKFIVKTKEEE